MSDLINRQDVLKLIENTPYDWSNITERTEMLRKINALPSADVPDTNVGEWIPCSERLPFAECGESDVVLVTCESTLIRLLYFNGGNWCYPTGECYEHSIDKVIAWMPLPEPWK